MNKISRLIIIDPFRLFIINSSQFFTLKDRLKEYSYGMQSMEYRYIEILKGNYLKKNEVNPLFKQNSFARSLNFSKAYLSKILNCKMTPSVGIALSIADKLKLTEDEQREFIMSILQSRIDNELKAYSLPYQFEVKLKLDQEIGTKKL